MITKAANVDAYQKRENNSDTVGRDRGDHFKVVGLKNLANARNIKFSVLPFIWHLRTILFTTSTNIT